MLDMVLGLSAFFHVYIVPLRIEALQRAAARAITSCRVSKYGSYLTIQFNLIQFISAFQWVFIKERA
jgi:hypothetical protein